MSVLRKLLLGSSTLVLLITLTPAARAGEWDQKVIATFNAPVEIPGQVLPMGTYVFKLFDSQSTRDIVQVSNADDTHVIAYVFSIPRYRATRTDDAVFMFEERGSDSPQAIQAWFYPGRLQGHQFIYGPGEAEVASASTPEPLSVSAEQPSPLVSAEPKIDEPKSEVVPESNTDQTQTAELQTAPAPSTTPSDTSTPGKELPKTASTTPLIALLGILSLGGGFGLRMLAKRVS